MTPRIRATENTTIPTISPILSPPVSMDCCLSASMVVTVVGEVVVAVKIVGNDVMEVFLCCMFPKHSGAPNLILKIQMLECFLEPFIQ